MNYTADPLLVEIDPSLYIHTSVGHEPMCIKLKTCLGVSQVLQIFRSKMEDSKLAATHVARAYGVSEKTIRDIWLGRTWKHATCALSGCGSWIPKKCGRPQGSKDRMPRKPRKTPPTACFTAITPEARESSTTPPSESEYLVTESRDLTMTKVEEGVYHHHKPKVDSASQQSALPASSSTSAKVSIDDMLFRWDIVSACSGSIDPFGEDWLVTV